MTARRLLGDERGNIAVETAITLPLMLLAIVGCLNFAIWSLEQSVIDEAARQTEPLVAQGASDAVLASTMLADMQGILPFLSTAPTISHVASADDSGSTDIVATVPAPALTGLFAGSTLSAWIGRTP
jgi:Flp pilus assembly protein TadG